MSKKSETSSIKNIGAGILDSLNGIKDENSKEENNEKSNYTLEEKNNCDIKDNNKDLSNSNSNTEKEQSSKSSKENKSKRSFMLSETAVQRLNLLKLCMTDKDLSTIVEESISMYFDKNKDSLEALISIYKKVK